MEQKIIELNILLVYQVADTINDIWEANVMYNRNNTRRPMHLRDMNACNVKMELNDFVGLNSSDDDEMIENKPIAMAYVPWQKWRMLYESKEALKRGTLFKELDLPFEAAKECK